MPSNPLYLFQQWWDFYNEKVAQIRGIRKETEAAFLAGRNAGVAEGYDRGLAEAAEVAIKSIYDRRAARMAVHNSMEHYNRACDDIADAILRLREGEI